VGAGASYDWKMATQLPLPMLLERTNVHVTQFSPSWREADKLGLPTAFVDQKVTSYFPDALKCPHNALCGSASDLQEFIQMRYRGTSQAETAYAVDYPQVRLALKQTAWAQPSPRR